MKSTCLGCFEIDSETRHFGLVKDGVIFGPGLRVNGKCIEMGQYQNNQLNGNGQRIEFGARFYKGEFLDDSFNGQGMYWFYIKNSFFLFSPFIFTFFLINKIGVLFDWNRNKRAKGTFRSGNIIQCRSECSFTIEDFDVLSK